MQYIVSLMSRLLFSIHILCFFTLLEWLYSFNYIVNLWNISGRRRKTQTFKIFFTGMVNCYSQDPKWINKILLNLAVLRLSNRHQMEKKYTHTHTHTHTQRYMYIWVDFPQSRVSLVAQLCLSLCDPIECSTPGFPVHQQLPELAQTHVHQVSDTIQPSHPLSPPSPFAVNLFQHQGLFQWVSYSHQVAKVLELQLQHQSFQWIFRTDFLYDWLVGSPCCPRDS